jgi:dolichol-phosphate mannosyltransferase
MSTPPAAKPVSLQPTGAESCPVVHIVLPAYNEASNVGALLRALDLTAADSGMNFHVIVVDDGSRDSTSEIARSFDGKIPVLLIVHPVNLGLGAAIRSGLLAAVETAGNDDVIVTMDADDTHTPGAIVQMFSKIEAGYDVLIASRYQPGSQVIGVPPFRRFLSFAASVLFRIVYPIPGVKDFTCGYRAYRASALRAAFSLYRKEFIDQEGFQCMVDILLKLKPMGLRFGEVPLLLRYDRKSGKSKMKVARTAWKTLLLLGRRRLGM